MRLQDILNMARNYLEIGVILAVVMVLFIEIGYVIIYKKIYKGQKRIDFKKAFWWFALVFYLFVVISVTLFSRNRVWNNGQVISFFYSYKEAWITASETAWRNIILNILMFVPLGFWLPLGKKRFCSFWKTTLVGCLLSVGIEIFQLILSLGLFEVADVFNNTLGTMIGYGFYKIVEIFIQLFKKEKTQLSRVAACQIPLILTICIFTGIFVAYENQELGNLSIECISPYAEDTFEIVSDEEYSSAQGKAMVYKTNTLTLEETEAFASAFFENLGTTLDETRNDAYEESVLYWAENSYSISIDYKGGSYNFTDFDTSYPDEGEEQPKPVTDATEEEIRDALAVYGIELPTEAVFMNNTDGVYLFTVERVEIDGNIYDGKLLCEYYDNGKFASIRNSIKKFDEYKEFDICSEQEAYEQILSGEFVGAINAGTKINLEQVSIEYMLDTKGYYQPIYNFTVDGMEEEQSIQIPAIRK